MSLRGFHIVFIILASLLCVFMAVWAIGFAPADAGVLAPLLRDWRGGSDRPADLRRLFLPQGQETGPLTPDSP